jgi:hypothetical protein
MISESFSMQFHKERSTPPPLGSVPYPPLTACWPRLFSTWPVVKRNDLILKRAQFVYAIHLRLPFCLCKHILCFILEARDESNTGLPFGCLLTQIILQSGISIAGEPKMKIQDPLSKQKLIKSNAQLWRDDPDDDDVPPRPFIPIGISSVAS